MNEARLQEHAFSARQARPGGAAEVQCASTPQASGRMGVSDNPARVEPSKAAGSLLIEIYGPPAVGKTTFARALVAALAERGIGAEIVASARPAEQAERRGAGGVRRLGSKLSAPLARASKLFTAIFPASRGEPSDPLTGSLLEIFPPQNWLWAARLRRYLSALHRSWANAHRSGRAVIFEQGYLCALCTLFTVSGRTDLQTLAAGLDLIPVPDLLIRLDAPREVLEARLRRRLDRQPLLERFFEQDVEKSLRQSEFAAGLDELLAERGRRPLCFGNIDQGGADAAAEAVVQALARSREEGLP